MKSLFLSLHITITPIYSKFSHSLSTTYHTTPHQFYHFTPYLSYLHLLLEHHIISQYIIPYNITSHHIKINTTSNHHIISILHLVFWYYCIKLHNINTNVITLKSFNNIVPIVSQSSPTTSHHTI